jgi:hypothetical protein
MLRTDLFKTVDRAETRFIAIRDTLTQADPDIDVKYLDALHCKRGKLGIGWHFLILVNGDIQLGRDVNTCGSHTKAMDTDSVAIAIVGGLDDEGHKAMTRNIDQIEAMYDTIYVLREMYPDVQLHDTPQRSIPTPP